VKPTSTAKNPERLTDEDKIRYRKVVLKYDIAAILKHPRAPGSLWHLATRGCDIALLWNVLVMYRRGDTGALTEGREEAKRFRASVSRIATRLSSVAKLVAAARAADTTVYNSVLDTLASKIEGLISDVAVAADTVGPYSDPRGRIRPEQFVAGASNYLRVHTGRRCYQEIADVLESVHRAERAEGDGAETDDAEVVDAENIRRICERYLKGLGNSEEASEQMDSLVRLYDNDDMTDILREELLLAIVPEHRRTRHSSKSDRPATVTLPQLRR
jgi:hypothetical protein